LYASQDIDSSKRISYSQQDIHSACTTKIFSGQILHEWISTLIDDSDVYCYYIDRLEADNIKRKSNAIYTEVS
jgi:hypothetical protein